MPKVQKTLLDEGPKGKKSKKKSSEKSMKKSSKKSNGNGKNGTIKFEDKLWQACDEMRNNMDPAIYKHIVLGLIFLKYISDAFEDKYKELVADKLGDPEDPDEYMAENIFWVPKEARWNKVKQNSKNPKIGLIVDEAMEEIEKYNLSLKGVLPKIYADKDLDKIVLGGVIDIVSNIGLGSKEDKSKDMLGRVYEYFLGKFAAQEGKGGGQFFTPTCVVGLLVEMIEPFKGRVYDPCCGSGGMFVQSEKFVESHGGKSGQIAIYGQESNPTTWKLAKMNLAIRGIEANLGSKHADSFHNDLHPSLKADYILANPPFNVKVWGGERLTEDIRWKYGISEGNANFAWIQHFIHHLAPHGLAGFVIANGALTSQTSNDDVIRKNIIKADLVDCVISLPKQLFFTTQIPASLWFISRDKENDGTRNRKGEILFIDARKYGTMIDRKNKELTDDDIEEISQIYHDWKSKGGNYEDKAGLCKSADLNEVKDNNYILSPGRYVGILDDEDDFEAFEEEFPELKQEIETLFEKSKILDTKIIKILKILEDEENYNKST